MFVHSRLVCYELSEGTLWHMDRCWICFHIWAEQQHKQWCLGHHFLCVCLFVFFLMQSKQQSSCLCCLISLHARREALLEYLDCSFMFSAVGLECVCDVNDSKNVLSVDFCSFFCWLLGIRQKKEKTVFCLHFLNRCCQFLDKCLNCLNFDKSAENH